MTDGYRILPPPDHASMVPASGLAPRGVCRTPVCWGVMSKRTPLLFRIQATHLHAPQSLVQDPLQLEWLGGGFASAPLRGPSRFTFQHSLTPGPFSLGGLSAGRPVPTGPFGQGGLSAAPPIPPWTSSFGGFVAAHGSAILVR